MLLLTLLALLYLHPTMLHITSQVLYARECSCPSAPSQSLLPSTSLPSSQSILSFSWLYCREPVRSSHSTLTPPTCSSPCSSPRSSRSSLLTFLAPHVPRAPPHAPLLMLPLLMLLLLMLLLTSHCPLATCTP